jgi:hypothetical protein
VVAHLPLLLLHCQERHTPQHADDADVVAAVLKQKRGQLVVAEVVALRLTEILDLVRPRKKVVAGGVVDRPPASTGSASTGSTERQQSSRDRRHRGNNSSRVGY